MKSPRNHHEITKLCGLHWIHSDRAVKPMRARRLSQRCRVAVWSGFCRKFMFIKGYDLYDYSHISKSFCWWSFMVINPNSYKSDHHLFPRSTYEGMNLIRCDPMFPTPVRMKTEAGQIWEKKDGLRDLSCFWGCHDGSQTSASSCRGFVMAMVFSLWSYGRHAGLETIRSTRKDQLRFNWASDLVNMFSLDAHRRGSPNVESVAQYRGGMQQSQQSTDTGVISY